METERGGGQAARGEEERVKKKKRQKKNKHTGERGETEQLEWRSDGGETKREETPRGKVKSDPGGEFGGGCAANPTHLYFALLHRLLPYLLVVGSDLGG